jgi:hypothetical protein
LCGRPDRQRATVIANRRLADPEVGQAVQMVGNFARSALERACRLVRRWDAQADQLSFVAQHGQLGRVVAIVQSKADHHFVLDRDLATQSK